MPYFDERTLQLLNNKQFYSDLINAETRVQALLEACSAEIRAALEPLFPEDSPLLKSAAKTTRGNNFLGYPWTIIDFPRKFESEGFMALRILCLRGHCFSITLHLSGETFKYYADRILSRKDEIPSNYFISTNADEWMHIIDEKNYRNMNNPDIDFEKELETTSYLKIAHKIPFEEAESLPQQAAETARILFEILR
ncbi:MAG TPA: hypothetical protein PLG57_11725 [Bacteroidia bacterium]|jgi:hypothetical protein|nr:hypothetical protein [Bacteroidia bacterium]HQF29713.1 hypothetical protein [Bacteroidia bacterium]